MAQSPIDLGKIIIDGNHNMLNSNTNSTPSGTDPKSILTSLLSTMSVQQNPTGLPQAAIDAATKVQKDYYTKHAQDVVNNSPDGISVLNQLIDTHNNLTQANNDSGASSSVQSQPQQQVQIPKQGLFETNKNYGMALSNTGMIQKLIAGQPGEIALPQAQAQQIGQEAIKTALANAGQTPIQPEQAAQLRATQNLAQITAMNDTIKNLQDRRNSLNTEFEQEGKTLSLMGRLGGLVTFQGQQMTPRQKAIKVEQNGIDKVLARMQTKMSGYSPENPAALKGTPGNVPPAPQGATHYSPSTGKFYDAQGQEMK